MVSKLSEIGLHFASVGSEVISSIKQKGVFNILNQWATTGTGLEKVSRVALFGFRFASTFSEQTTNYLSEAVNSQQLVTDGLYSILSLKYIAQLTNNTNTKTTRYNICSRILLAISSVCESVYFLIRTQLIEKTTFTELSAQFGQFSIFQYKPFDSFLTRPSQLFLFLGSLTSSLENLYIHKSNKDAWSEWFKARDLLLHIGNGGKVLLTYYHSSIPSQGTLLYIDGITRIADLLRYSIKL